MQLQSQRGVATRFWGGEKRFSVHSRPSLVRNFQTLHSFHLRITNRMQSIAHRSAVQLQAAARQHQLQQQHGSSARQPQLGVKVK